MSQFHQPICTMRKGARKKVNGKKMLFHFIKVSTEILLLIFSYNFYAKHIILVHFCQTLLPLKASEIICIKQLHFGANNVGEIVPWKQKHPSLLFHRFKDKEKKFWNIFSYYWVFRWVTDKKSSWILIY